MKKVIIIGAGGHSAEITDYIAHYNSVLGSEKHLEVLGYIDDNKENYDSYSFVSPYLGTIQNHEVLEHVEYIMGIANIQFRRTIVENFLQKGAKFATLIHPSAIVSPSAIVGEGCVVAHNASIGPKAIIGNFNMLNSRCTIGHDSTVGNFNFIGPQVVLSGFTKVGNNNMFGVNSATIPTIEIGDNNTIAAGMIITKTVKDTETHFYRFKEKVVIT